VAHYLAKNWNYRLSGGNYRYGLDMKGFWPGDNCRIIAVRLNEKQHRKTLKKQMAEDLYTWSEHWSVYDIEKIG